MKNLAKLVSLALLSIIALKSNAQGFILQGGFNLSQLAVKMDGEVDNEGRGFQPGFQMGFAYEIPIYRENLVLSPGLIINTKGTKIVTKESFGSSTYTESMKANLYYLEIPLAMRYYFDTGESRVYLGAGPYVAFGLIGNVLYKATYSGDSESYVDGIMWGEDGLTRFDAGLLGGLGAEFGNFQIGAQYGLGLMNVLSDGDSDNSIKNQVLSFIIAYRIGG